MANFTCVFHASGDACGACQALDGLDCASQPHPNCACQIEIKREDSDCSFLAPAGWFESVPYGPGPYDFSFGGEVTVICPDGTEIGGSFSVNVGEALGPGASQQSIDLIGFLDSQVDAAVDGLCDCPDEEGDDDLVA